MSTSGIPERGASEQRASGRDVADGDLSGRRELGAVTRGGSGRRVPGRSAAWYDGAESAERDAELASLEAELAGVERRVERRSDPGLTALGVAAGMLVLLFSLVLPWTGSTRGWEVLAGTAGLGVLPPLFAFTAVGFGVVGSALALATRWWGLSWMCAVGCGFSVVDGVWAIWSRQVTVPHGGNAAHIGLVVALLAVLGLAFCWVRIALRR